MTDDLLARLTAVLNEEERVALAAHEGGGPDWSQVDADRTPGRIEDAKGYVITYDEGSPSSGEAAHVALHDPARVLRQVEAHRDILARHHPFEQAGQTWCDACTSRHTLVAKFVQWDQCPEVQAVVGVYLPGG